MRYSYCWDVTPRSLFGEKGLVGREHWPDRAYVRLPGPQTWNRVEGGDIAYPRRFLMLGCPLHRGRYCPGPPRCKPEEWLGRVMVFSVLEDANVRWEAEIDATASHFHPASIAGLLVGAMGVFVFAVALRHWLGQRRAAMVLEGP